MAREENKQNPGKKPDDGNEGGGAKASERVHVLRIISKKAGFRRGGIAHPDTPVFHRADKFSKEQLQQLKDEPVLIVEEGEGPDPEKYPEHYADGLQRRRDED